VGVCSSISDCGFRLLNQRASENQNGFFVYKDADSGLNHGFPSGLFSNRGFDLTRVELDAACIDDPRSPTGCAIDNRALDAARGNVFRITFPKLNSGEFVGLHFQEPQNYAPTAPGNGYELSPATAVQFDVRSPDRIRVQFGVGGCISKFYTLDPYWQTITIPLSPLNFPESGLSCLPNISATNLLFTVVTNVNNAPAGGAVLLDNIEFIPTPARQKTNAAAISFPVSTQTFGVVANQRLPIPTDQVNRNLATITESALTALALLHRQQPGDVANALKIADAFHYALYHDNHGDPVPASPQSSGGCYSGSPAQRCGLHTAYINGDTAFFNNQPAPALGQVGDVRLAGFSSGAPLCGDGGFCLVLDGATGGDNAWAILALIAAFEQSGDVKYLNDAIVIGNWIFANLADNGGYSGYFVGYTDGGFPKQRILGKATTYNAQIYAAYNRLAQVETARGNLANAAEWKTRANAAANFVLQMFDPATGRFYAGTVKESDAGLTAPGLCPDVSKKKEDDVVNACDSLDSITMATLALANSFPNALDWKRPLQYALSRFTQTASAGGKVFSGFDLSPTQGAGRVGVAWEFTSQMALAMNAVGEGSGSSQLVNSASFYLSQIRQAQTSAPFGDGQGIVGSTLQNGDVLPPYFQCLSTPFQCIPQRVGLAATSWAVFAEQKFNPLFGNYEADVASRNSGNGLLTIADWVQVGRFVAGLDTPANSGEFQRADCAPRSAFGDGRLSLVDWIQAGRYVAGLDPVVPAGGPSSPRPTSAASVGIASAQGQARGAEARLLRAADERSARHPQSSLSIEFDAQGDESGFGFSLSFDPGKWRFVSAAVGRDAIGATLHINRSQVAGGQVGIMLALPPGRRLATGSRQIALVRFAPVSGQRARSTEISFGELPVKREVVDVNAHLVPSIYALRENQ
jgi:hypothetical protein